MFSLLLLVACSPEIQLIAADDTASDTDPSEPLDTADTDVDTDVDDVVPEPPAPDSAGGWQALDCAPNFGLPTADWTAYPSPDGPRPVEALLYYTNGTWIDAQVVVWSDAGELFVTGSASNATGCAVWEWISD